ncbi:MAG: SRPBCC family protein [Actinobacteria bacterium]|nr:SRPBCC family protein [Actinomycetota bacterium]
MTTFSESVTIDAPTARVWAVLADVGSIADWNDGVQESHLIDSSNTTGLGAKRFCGLGGKNFLHESVVTFDDERALTMRIDETNLPFKSADIHFTLAPVNAQTRVTVSPVYVLKYGVLGQIMNKLMVAKKYRSGMVDLLNGLKQHVEAAN